MRALVAYQETATAQARLATSTPLATVNATATAIATATTTAPTTKTSAKRVSDRVRSKNAKYVFDFFDFLPKKEYFCAFNKVYC